MNALFANVAVPLPLHELFTYAVPSDLENDVGRGSVVSVPFGKKTVHGIVVSLERTPPSFSVKPIRDLVDIAPIDAPDADLAEWIADYYGAPIGESFRLFLPAGLSLIGKTTVTLVKDERPYAGSLDRNARRIVDTLLSTPRMTLAHLRTKTGVRNTAAVVNTLAQEGIVAINEDFRSATRRRTGLFFSRSSLETTPSLRGNKQQEAWQKILLVPAREDQAVPPFLHEHQITLSTLRSLEAKGLIQITKKPFPQRTPLLLDEDARKSLAIRLNSDQQVALQSITGAIDTNRHRTFLLHGITGSGKTQVYIDAIRHCIARKKSSIVLVPEISLTPQTVQRFQAHFGDRVVWVHSRLSAGERFEVWRHARTEECSIVIGPRSALFAPVRDLGLIVVDEEHEQSYKQFDAVPRYHARDVAIVKASRHQAVIVLGSATPSIESYHNAQSGKYTLLTLPIRADNARLPPVTIVSMVDERKRRYEAMKQRAKEIGKAAFAGASRSISDLLESKIRDRLNRHEGIIILQNRRGFAPFLECDDCGEVQRCDHCSVTLTYHAPQKHLRCHYCGRVSAPPTTCPHCGGHALILRGFGTQRVEEELSGLFPEAVIVRMDLDTTTAKQSHEKILRQFGEGRADILLGTQMVAKGLDFPRVTLVGVISADTQMMLPDFRSAERTFQLLTQVAGRAGRSTLEGEVIIQTSQPDHYALAHVKDHDFKGFYNEELSYRSGLHYPPFSRIILVELKGSNERRVETCALSLGQSLTSALGPAPILGPSPAVISRIKNEYRWQVIVKAEKTSDVNATVARRTVAQAVGRLRESSAANGVRIGIDVDPVGIM